MSSKDHAPLSPSSFKRLMLCPGSYYLTKDMPDTPTSKYAVEGTAVHEIVDKCWKLYEETGAIQLNSLTEDEEIVEEIGKYFNFCFELENKFKALCDENESAQVKRFIEKKIYLNENIWGTVDYALAGKRNGKLEIIICDLKWGAGVKVTAQDNPQLIIYGLGINKELGNIADKIRCYVYQPRIEGEKKYSSFVLMKEDIRDWTLLIYGTELQILDIGDTTVLQNLHAGDHCRWCKAIATCPERNKTALSLIEPIKEITKLPLVPTEKLIEVFKAKKQFEYMLDAVEAHLTRLAEAGIELEGLKLVQSRGKRSWAFKGKELEQKLLDIADAQGFYKDSVYKQAPVINLTDAEKLLGTDNIKELISPPAVRNQLVAVDDERTEIETINLIDEIKND